MSFAKEDIKMVKTSALANKHKCSEVYVRCVLTGTRAANSELAQTILKDANDIVAIFERETRTMVREIKLMEDAGI